MIRKRLHAVSCCLGLSIMMGLASPVFAAIGGETGTLDVDEDHDKLSGSGTKSSVLTYGDVEPCPIFLTAEIFNKIIYSLLSWNGRSVQVPGHLGMTAEMRNSVPVAVKNNRIVGPILAEDDEEAW